MFLDSEGCTALMCIDTGRSSRVKEEERDYVGCAKLLLQCGTKINLFEHRFIQCFTAPRSSRMMVL